MSELSPYLLLLLVGFLPNEIWRWLGIVVATAVLAGVIARIIVLPPGALAGVAMPVRVGAMALGFAGFLVLRRSALAGIVIGEGALMLGAVLFGSH
jgi:hypothetical protein